MALPSLDFRSYWRIRKTVSQFVRDHRVPNVGLLVKMAVVPFVFYVGINWGANVLGRRDVTLRWVELLTTRSKQLKLTFVMNYE